MRRLAGDGEFKLPDLRVSMSMIPVAFGLPVLRADNRFVYLLAEPLLLSLSSLEKSSSISAGLPTSFGDRLALRFVEEFMLSFLGRREEFFFPSRFVLKFIAALVVDLRNNDFLLLVELGLRLRLIGCW